MVTLPEWRIQTLWSQRELAERARVAQRTIALAESGQRLPRLLTMRRIADALGVPWEERSPNFGRRLSAWRKKPRSTSLYAA